MFSVEKEGFLDIKEVNSPYCNPPLEDPKWDTLERSI